MRYLLLILMLTLNASAANYYVDYDGGSDSNDGSSGTPFKYPPGARLATGNSASTTLSAGDTVFFKGGVTHIMTNGVILKWSGSSGSPITYDMTGSSYGTGQAILTTTNVSTSLFVGTNNAWLKFTGGMITNVGGYTEDNPVWSSTNAVTSPPGGTGINLLRSTNCVIENIIFSELGQWQNTAPMDGTGSVTGNGVYLRGGVSNYITGCEFTRMHTGISIRGEQHAIGNVITNISIHNYVNWGIQGVIPDAQGSFIGNIIRNSRFYDCREFDNNRWTGTGDSPHQNYIFFYATGLSGTNRGTWTNNFITENLFYDDDTGASGGTSAIYLEWGPTVTVAFNVFKSPRAGAHVLSFDKYKDDVSYAQARAFNNTFYTSSRPLNTDEGQGNNDSYEVFNNSLGRQSTSTSANAWSAQRTNLVADFNVFWSLVSPIGNWDVIYTGGYWDLAGWQGYSLQDSNSVVANPLYNSVAGSPSTWDLRPMAGSPLLSMTGSNLYDRFTIYAPRDFDGIEMPSTGTWPIGAYSTTNGVAQGGAINRASRFFRFKSLKFK